MDKFSDMAMFVGIVKHHGLAAAGRELGLSPATMTARLQALGRAIWCEAVEP